MAAASNTARPRCKASRAASSIACSATMAHLLAAPGPIGGTFRTSACAPATDFIFRFRLRPRRIASATTSSPASACARRRKSRFTPITIPARKWPRRSRSTASSTPSCRTRSTTASARPACSCRKPGESWAQALKANGTDDTVAPGDIVVTEQNAKRFRSRASAPTESRSGPPRPPPLSLRLRRRPLRLNQTPTRASGPYAPSARRSCRCGNF